MMKSEAAALEELERQQQYVLGMMENGFQEGYKMGLQDGWSKGFEDGYEETRRQFREMTVAERLITTWLRISLNKPYDT
jgi:flagellar biosynthesis/type III secretory pathway protein FliH